MITAAATTFDGTARALARRGLVGALACSASLLGMVSSSAFGQLVPKDVPAEIKGLEVTNNLGKVIPLHLQVTTADGKIVSLKEFFNRPTMKDGKPSGKGSKPVVIQMAYYRCPILCPTILDKFTKTIDTIDFTVGEDFDVLVVSFDHRDTPADARSHHASAMLAYNRPENNDIRSGWNFVIASPETSRQLGDALGFPFRYLPESDQYSHGTALFVLTPEGKISSYLTGLNYPAKDVKLALLDASNGKIGSFWDAFPLWCYHFDPNAGSYTLQAMRVMQIGSGGAAVLLGGLLGTLWVTERRRRRIAARSDSAVMGGSATRTSVPASNAAHDSSSVIQNSASARGPSARAIGGSMS